MASYAILTNGYRTTPSQGAHVADWEYATTDNGGTIILKKYIGSSPIVKVPAKIGGMNVILGGTTNTNSQNIYNGQPFYNNEDIRSVTIEPGVDTAPAFNAYQYFYNCANLQTVDWSTFNVTTNIGYMFYGCHNLIRVNTPDWYCTNSRNAARVFANCYNLIESPLHFDAGIFLNGPMNMFSGCRSLTTIPVRQNGTNNTIYCDSDYVVNFYDCRKLKNIPIRSGAAGEDSFHNCHSLESQPSCYYNTSDSTNMFRNCYNLKGNIMLVNGSYVNSLWNFTSVCENCYNITGISFSTSANRMNDFSNAFRNCYNLTTIQESINSPGVISNMAYAFANCTKLTSFPWAWSNNSCNYAHTFDNTGMTTGFVNNPVGASKFNYTFANCKNLTSVGTVNCTSSGTALTGVFYNCRKITTLPTQIKNAHLNNAFQNCVNLTTVGNFVSVGAACNTFKGCNKLTDAGNINVSNGANCFSGCVNLKYVNGINATDNASEMFASCNNLKQVNTINGKVFTNIFRGCTNLTYVNFAKAANTYYMNHAFYGCTNIPSITLSNVHTFAMEGMCQGCTNLKTVHFDYDSNGTSECNYSNYAFAQCSNLTTINIIATANASNYRRIYFYNMNYMFQDCTNLTSLPFNKSWFYNPYNSFENCTKLTTLTFNHAQFNIYANTFVRSNNINKLDFGTSATAYLRVSASSAFPNLTSINGYANAVTANAFANCSKLTTVTNLRLANSSANYLFHNCANLTSVHFNSSYTFTNGYAMFKNCKKLTTMNNIVPVSNDARYIFDGCVNLTGNIKFSEVNINYFTGAFNNTSLSKNVYIPYTINTSVTTNSKTRNSAVSANINGNNGVTLYNYWNA